MRCDIPSRQLDKHEFSDGIEGIFLEINLRHSKWLLFGTYHPPSQNDAFYFNNIARSLDTYTTTYHKIILAGDFNAEEGERELDDFMDTYGLKSLVKEKTCFKSLTNPTSIDLFLTNCNRSFQHTHAVSTGVSDFHKMIVTVLKTKFEKAKPREIQYRCYRNFDKYAFRNHLRSNLAGCENYTQFEQTFLEVLNIHAPVKKKIVRANEVPYMTKALRKAIATRSRLENRAYNTRLNLKLISVHIKGRKIIAADCIKKNEKGFIQILMHGV